MRSHGKANKEKRGCPDPLATPGSATDVHHKALHCHMAPHVYMYVSHMYMYTLEQEKMYLLVRCPDFRGCNVQTQGVLDNYM